KEPIERVDTSEVRLTGDEDGVLGASCYQVVDPPLESRCPKDRLNDLLVTRLKLSHVGGRVFGSGAPVDGSLSTQFRRHDLVGVYPGIPELEEVVNVADRAPASHDPEEVLERSVAGPGDKNCPLLRLRGESAVVHLQGVGVPEGQATKLRAGR